MSDKHTSRRDFVRVTAIAGGGFLLGLQLTGRAKLAHALAPAEPFAPNAWIRIGTDGIVTVTVHKAEMGQGVNTSLPMIAAEELEADWSKVRVETAPADPKYIDPGFGLQITGGSTSVGGSYQMLRTAGATAREMLVAAAATTWGVDAATCLAQSGFVVHPPTGRRLGYGELASAAASVPVPKEPRLKDPTNFKIIGTRTKKLDSPSKVNGTAVYGIDFKVPGMLVAVVARPPVFGATLASHDAAKALAIMGVKQVVPISSGVAIVADGYWPATQGRKALAVTWNEGNNVQRSTATISQQLRDGAKKAGLVARHDGDAAAEMPRGAKRVQAEYEVPFLAHATMEPMNCTAHVHDGRCDVWGPIQWQDKSRAVAASVAGLPLEQVAVYTTLLGGGFGRRLETDFIEDAVEISKKVGAPVKVIYSREDDVQHDFYRTAAYYKASAALGADGWPSAWTTTIVSDSSLKRMLPMFIGKDGLDPDSVEGLANSPYDVKNVHVEWVYENLGVPVGAWRAVGATQGAFMRECFVDELAAAAGKDPVEFRRHLLTDKRHLGVLNLAAEKSGWGKPLPAGHFRGVAMNQLFGTYVAEVAEVSIEKGAVKVHRITSAVDCGLVVNPDGVEAQIEGGIIFGLTAALKGEITIERGRVKQGNFNDYQMIRMAETPRIDVHIVPSTEAPTGVGEPGVPPVAPAVANAVRAATGVPVRSLPIRLVAAMPAGTPKTP